MLPDPQVLLKLLSTSSYKNPKQSWRGLKRCAAMPESGFKKLKSDVVSEDIDIVISGIDAKQTDDSLEDSEQRKGAFTHQELDGEKDHTRRISDIWV